MSPPDLIPGSRVRATHLHTVLGIVGPDLMLPVTSVGTRFYMVGFFPWRVVAGNLGAKPPTFGDVILWLQSCQRPKPAIFIAETPATLSRRVYMALIGGGVHEALHRLLTCQRTLSPREVMDLVTPRFGDVNWPQYRKLLLDLNNILEDIWIERIGNAMFPGIYNKLADLGDFILDMEAPVRKQELDLPEPPTSRIVFATIRELGLGYNTEKSRAAIAHYKFVDPGAVHLLTQGGLADMFRKMVPDVSTPRAVEQARMDLDRGITLSLAMDTIRALIDLGKVKPPPPAPPAPPKPPPPQEGEDEDGGAPGGEPEDGESGGEGAPESPLEEDPEEEPGDPTPGGDASEDEGEPDEDPEDPEDEGSGSSGGKEDEEDPEEDEGDPSGSGSGDAPEEGDPEEGDPEGPKDGDPEVDPKGSPMGGNEGDPSTENTPEEGAVGHEADEEGTPAGEPEPEPEEENAGGSGAGGPGAADDAKTLEQFLADHEAHGSGLKDASTALEEAIIKEFQAEVQAQPKGEMPYRPFTTAADEILEVPRVSDTAAAAFRAAVAPTRRITSYLRTHLSRWFQGLEQGGREHGLQRGAGLSDRMLVDTIGSLRDGRDPRRAFYEEEEEMDMSLAVAVVIDQSGSMQGKQVQTGGLAYALGSTFDQIRARSMFVGFRSVGDREKERLVVPLEVMAQTPNHGYHRVHLVRYDMYKRWHEEFRLVSNRLSCLRADGNTPMADGIEFALQELSHRPEAFRFLIVLTDGVPNGGTQPVIRGQVRRATEAGIGILGVGVGGSDGSYVEIFKDFVHREKLEDLPPPLIRKFMEMLRLSISKRGRKVRA